KHGFHFMVSTDADGQFDPEQIPELLKPLVLGACDFVLGNRFSSQDRPEHMPWIKHWGNQQMSWLVSTLTGQKFQDVSCGFRAYSREALLQLNLMGQFTYTHETILDLCNKGLVAVEVPIRVRYFQGRV